MEENLEFIILNYFKTKNPEIIVKAPARINLINPLDAVEGDFWAPAMAITSDVNPLSVYCYIKEISRKPSKLQVAHLDDHKNEIVDDALYEFTFQDLFLTQKFWESDELNIFFGTLHYLFQQIPEFRPILKNRVFEIGILSTIPRQSGIAGSSAIIIALLYAFGSFCHFNPEEHDPSNFSKLAFNKDIIGELATKIENDVLHNTAGYGDRITISRGGLGFASYVGKLHHKDIGQEPLTVYDRVDKVYNITEIPIILAFSGVIHHSGSIHSKLREEYLAKNQTLLELFEELAEISWKSRFNLMHHDWKSLGEIFNKNTELSEKIMTCCGFEYGIGWANKILIDLIKDDPDVFSVKLSGAGGGGSVFALVSPKNKKEIRSKWKQRLEQLLLNPKKIQEMYPNISLTEIEQLSNAKFYEIKINKKGVSTIKF